MISENGINAALAQIEGFAPQNEVEAVLAVQMACSHTAALSALAKLDNGQGPVAWSRPLPILSSCFLTRIPSHSGLCYIST